MESYRDKSGNTKQRVLERYGELKELEREDPNILETLREKAKLKTAKQNRKHFQLTVDITEPNETNDQLVWGIGFLEKVYREIGVGAIANKFLADETLKLLAFARLMNLEPLDLQERLFGNWGVTENDIKGFEQKTAQIEEALFKQVKRIEHARLYFISLDKPRDTEFLCLLVDNDNFPIYYEIMNIPTAEAEYQRIRDIKHRFKVRRLTVIIEHIRHTKINSEQIGRFGCDYLFVNLPRNNTPIRFAHTQFGWNKSTKLAGHWETVSGLQMKTTETGRKRTEKVVSIYSEERKIRSRKRRQFTLDYAKSLLHEKADILSDTAKIQERWDGVRIVTTSLTDHSDEQILQFYVEHLIALDFFKSSKPSEILIDFVAAQIAGIIYHSYEHPEKFSYETIENGVLGATCIHFGQGIYRIFEPSETRELEEVLNMPLGRKYMKLEELRQFVLRAVPETGSGF